MSILNLNDILVVISLLNDKFLDLTKFKAFADNKSNVCKIMISLLDRVEYIVGKGCFLKVVKSWDCVVKV